MRSCAETAQEDECTGICDRGGGLFGDGAFVRVVQRAFCEKGCDPGDGAVWHDDLYDFLFLFRNQCDHIILFYVNRKSARVRGDIPLEGACGAAGVHLCASGVFWHDGRVACCAGDGDHYGLYQCGVTVPSAPRMSSTGSKNSATSSPVSTENTIVVTTV